MTKTRNKAGTAVISLRHRRLVDFVLTQDQMIVAGPGTDHMYGVLAQRPVTGLPGPPQAFAINRNHLAAGLLADRLDPTHKGRLEFVRIQTRKHAPKSVVRRYSIGQLQKGLKPDPFGFAKFFNVHPTIRSTDGRADGHQHDVK